MKSRIIVFLIFVSVYLFAQKVEFITDWESAKNKAALENKNILVVLTGSEWCKPCKKMDRRLFSNPEFNTYTSANLIIFLVDLPKELVVNSIVYQQFMEFKEKYQTSALSSLVLTDTEGARIKVLKGKMHQSESVLKQLQVK